jgi:hypothetical protein
MDGGMGGMGMGGASMIAVKPAWEMPVEVYGVIYLYNPVDIKRLGLDKVTENTELTDKVEAPAAGSEQVPAQSEATAPANAENGNVATNPAANAGKPAPAAGAPAGSPANAGGAPAGSSGVPANPNPANPNPANPNGVQPPANPR